MDADIGFEPEQVVRPITCGADVVAGIYPIKRLNRDKVRKIAEANRPDIAAAGLDYVLEVDDPETIIVTNGFARARYVGTDS